MESIQASNRFDVLLTIAKNGRSETSRANNHPLTLEEAEHRMTIVLRLKEQCVGNFDQVTACSIAPAQEAFHSDRRRAEWLLHMAEYGIRELIRARRAQAAAGQRALVRYRERGAGHAKELTATFGGAAA